MLLETKDLTKSYGKITALREVSVAFENGVYGILGANGAGKTTLINLLIGNLRPDRGQILCDGKSIAELGKTYRGRLGYVPQQNTLYDGFSAQRFLWYIASVKGLTRKQARKKVDEVLEIVNLRNCATQRLGGFSGGMKRRVMIAQALLNDPELLIMDEPTAGLDPKERIEVRNFISRVSFQKIVLLATHIVQDIEVISHEVLLMKKGVILRKEDPASVTRDMQGHVFETSVPMEQIEPLQRKYKIGNLIKVGEQVQVRLICEDRPPLEGIHEVTPTLEDLYLYALDEQVTSDE